MYIACEKCKYNYDGECDFYDMGSGNEIDMPCYREKELIKEAADNFLQAFVGAESENKGMSEISEVEIKAMSKEQNYLRGYSDGKYDVLEKIKAEIYEEFMTIDGGVHDESAKKCMRIIDKYKAESEKE